MIMFGALLYVAIILFLFGRQLPGDDRVPLKPSISPLTTEHVPLP